MQVVDRETVLSRLAFKPLIAALGDMFRDGCVAPVRHHHAIAATETVGGADLLLMPAWQHGRHIGIKIVTVFPDNALQALPAVMASYVLLDGQTGQPRAFIDGEALTVRRTAAASALAAGYLARAEAKSLTMIGTGAMAPHLIDAHAAQRPLEIVRVWGRSPAKAAALVAQMQDRPFQVELAEDRQAAVRAADIVSCATLSKTPLVEGDWLQPGTHVDLVGAFKADMRESDDMVMTRGRIFGDTRPGALAEAGDLLLAFAAGAVGEADIEGDLFELCRGQVSGRRQDDEITVFKSVGTALEDLAAAILVTKN